VASLTVVWSDAARDEVAWLRVTHGVDLLTPVERALALGPEPHPYRRIRKEADGSLRLAVKDWRIRFVAEEGSQVRVLGIETGYRAKELASGAAEELRVHREFCARWRSAGC
jgi:hypothetical protein